MIVHNIYYIEHRLINLTAEFMRSNGEGSRSQLASQLLMQIKGKCKAGNAVRWRRKRKRAKGKGVTELEVVVSSSSSTTSFHPSPSPAQTWPGRFGRRFWLDATKLAGSHLASPRLCLITNMSFLFGQYYSTAS